MIIDKSLLVYKEGCTDFNLADEIPGGIKIKLNGFTGACKAYLWDHVNRQMTTAWEPGKTIVVYAQNSTPEQLKEIQDRLAPLEKAFKFLKSKLTVQDGWTIVEASPRWLAHVNMFSLLLSAIRYENVADKNGYDFALTDIEKLKTWYAENCKNKPVKESWIDCNHGAGICDFLKVSLVELGVRYP